MIYTYNKLVRDKIPEEINNVKGRKANYRVLNDNEYLHELDKNCLKKLMNLLKSIA